MLKRIAACDGRLRSYVTVLPDAAREQARQAEQEIMHGSYRGPLHGVPIAVKDLFFTEGVRTTCGSALLAEWVPGVSATVVEKLRGAGALVLGKLALTEFAIGGYPPPFSSPVNPWGVNRWPGASSSGSGVAVAAGLCFGALGTDTGGSIRAPSAVCGIVGIKPTYGRVSRHGVFPLGESLDHVGPMTRSVADAGVLLNAIAGFDANDPTSLLESVSDFRLALGRELRGVRVGVDEAYCTTMVHPEVSTTVLAAVQQLRDLGAVVEEVTIPLIEDVLSAFWVIICTEAAAAHELTFPSQAEQYGSTVRSILEQGAQMGGVEYAKAHATRQAFRGALRRLFEDVDLLACPSFPMPAFDLDLIPPDAAMGREALQFFLPFFRFSAPYNPTGSPTISVLCGFSADGLPISLQLIGRYLEEALLCQVAHAYEQATEWHRRRPSL
jgi:amidase